MNIIKFEIIDTNQIIIDALVNGVNGSFIVDTGASGSCIDINVKDKFNLKTDESINKITAAGSSEIETEISNHNNLSVGNIEISDFSFVITDLSHINYALNENKCNSIDGIIGADVLIEYCAVINYFNQIITFKFN